MFWSFTKGIESTLCKKSAKTRRTFIHLLVVIKSNCTSRSSVHGDSDLTFIWSVVDLFDCLAFGPQLQALQFPDHLGVVKHELLTTLLKQKHDIYHLNCSQKTDKDPK